MLYLTSWYCAVVVSCMCPPCCFSDTLWMCYSWKRHTNSEKTHFKKKKGLSSDSCTWNFEHQVVIRFKLQAAVFLNMEILIRLWNLNEDHCHQCRPLPVKVLNGSSCHTGRNKKHEASTQYFLNIYVYVLLHAQRGPLIYMLSWTKSHICSRVHVCLH